MKDKSQYTVSLEKSQYDFLTEMVKKYNLSDESKALRCLINFATEEESQRDAIFSQIRCLHC